MIIENILTISLFWFLGWGGLLILLRNRNNYIKNYVTVSLYFLLISFLLLYYFRDIIDPIYKNLNIFILIITSIIIMGNFHLYKFFTKNLKKPLSILEKYSSLDFLHLNKKYLISKIFEILYQQILIIVLVYLLRDYGLSIVMITIIFLLLFGLGHIPSIFLSKRKGFFRYFILIASICASFFFPYIILTFHYGFIYTYLIHIYFYTSSGLLFWLIDGIKTDRLHLFGLKSLEIRKIKSHA